MLLAPYPADTLAKGWRFEIDLEKIERSDTWFRAKTGAVRGALLLLWSRSWQQTPCGTLPDDDELVSLLIDMPQSTFAKHRSILMRGWQLADDGRLYHETITTRVLAMLEKRKGDAIRSAESRARRAASKLSPSEVTDESRVTHTGLTSEFDTKHQAPSTKHQKTEPVGSVPARKARGSKRCPESFEVTSEMREWAAGNASKADLERETLKLRNYEFSKAKTDWLATWQNWMLTADERAAPSLRAASSIESFRERDERVARERYEQFVGIRRPVNDATIIEEVPNVAPRQLG